MNVIFQSILLLFCTTIAECCTYLPNNELAIVTIINETTRVNIQSLFIKQELTNLILKNNDSNLNVQQYIQTHSIINRTFNSIISIKVLNSQHDSYPLNQYLLLNQNNDQLELFINQQIFGQQNRLPEFIKKNNFSNQQCYDADFLNKTTIILDCYNETFNYFILQNEDNIQYIEDQSLYINQTIKRKLFAYKNNIIMRVIYYNEEFNTSLIQFFEKDIFNNILNLTIQIDNDFLNDIIEEDEIDLQIIHLQYEKEQLHILNHNQMIIQLNISSLQNIFIIDYHIPDYLSNIQQIQYHYESQTIAYLSLNLLLLMNETEKNIYFVDNNNKQSQIYFTQNELLLINNDTLFMFNLTLKKLSSQKIPINSKFIINQQLDEVLLFNEEQSIRLLLSTTKYLILQIPIIQNDWKLNQLTQHINLIESCTLKIKYKSILFNSTQAIPSYQYQFDAVLNNYIEQFEVQRFIEGPNVQYENINQLLINNVTFSLSFEQLIQKGIGGITIEGNIIYARILGVGGFNYYFLQLEKLDVQMYLCTGSMNYCQLLAQDKFEFNLVNVSHEFFIYQYSQYIAVKNNQQLDIWNLQNLYNQTYTCTIYPDQEYQILQFLYINTLLAVLYSNKQIVLYSAIDQCQKIVIISNETIEIEYWNPEYISVSEALNILFIKSSNQLILMKVNQNEVYPIHKIQLNHNNSIAIFSYSNIFWIYYKDTNIIESFNFISQTQIYQKCQISLYNIIPNKFIHSQKSKYVYFQYSQDSLGTVQVYNLESSCHNAFQITFQTKYKILQSISNLFIMADMSNYFEISETIKYSIYYQNIRNSNYIVQVNTSLIITNFDRRDKFIYDIHSSLVNPFTTITVNETQLGLIDYLNQQKPIGFCQDKYGWYTGQVVDFGLKSSQVKLRKSMHLIDLDVSPSGIDATQYYDDSILILHQEKLIKFNLQQDSQKLYYLDNQYIFIKIININKPIIFLLCRKQFVNYIYSINCDDNFNCYKQFEVKKYVWKINTIKIYQDLIFYLSDSNLQIEQFKEQEIINFWDFQNNLEQFQEIGNPKQNLFQIYTINKNIFNIYLYKFEDNVFQKQNLISKDLSQTIILLGFQLDPKIQFSKITLLKENTQQQLYTYEIICQSSYKSHYILQIQQICQNEVMNCTINHIKVLQILQGYGGWPSGKLTIFKQQYLLMIYYQASTYLTVLYNIEKNYAHDINSSTLFTGAIQYFNQSNSHYAFFQKDSQVQFLTNALNNDVYALFEIYNTTQFCIQDHLKNENIKLTLKNNFDCQEVLIDININENEDNSHKVVIWIIFGLIGSLIIIFIILGIFYMKCKKKKIENNPFI